MSDNEMRSSVFNEAPPELFGDPEIIRILRKVREHHYLKKDEAHRLVMAYGHEYSSARKYYNLLKQAREIMLEAPQRAFKRYLVFSGEDYAGCGWYDFAGSSDDLEHAKEIAINSLERVYMKFAHIIDLETGSALELQYKYFSHQYEWAEATIPIPAELG